MELQNKILDVIKENITAAQIGLLKDHFELASKNEAELSKTKVEMENLRITFALAISERDKLQSANSVLISKAAYVDAKTLELDKALKDIELRIAQENLAACKASYAEMKDLMATVFRNPKFIHTQQHEEYHQGYNTPNGWVSDHNVNKTYKTSTEQE